MELEDFHGYASSSVERNRANGIRYVEQPIYMGIIKIDFRTIS